MTDLSLYTIDERREAINQVIFNERDRTVLEMRLIDGKGYKEIGAVVRLENRQIYNILSKGSASVADYLEGKRKKRFRIW